MGQLSKGHMHDGEGNPLSSTGGSLDVNLTSGTLPISVAATLETRQVSGVVDSVNIVSQDIILDVRQASGSVDSVWE